MILASLYSVDVNDLKKPLSWLRSGQFFYNVGCAWKCLESDMLRNVLNLIMWTDICTKKIPLCWVFCDNLPKYHVKGV